MKVLRPSNGSTKFRPGPARSKARRRVAAPTDSFASLVGSVHDLPDDTSINFDYYLHGTRKQRPRRGRWLKDLAHAKPFTPSQARRFNDRLDALAADIGNLPPDLAKNHDHYIHGHPKT